MSFRDRPFFERFSKLGDEAEGVFQEVYPFNSVRFGLDRPNINLAKVPPFVRYTPDFLTGKGLVEAQGFGKDQKFKVKDDKLIALTEWSRHFRVDFFVWDSWYKRYGWIRLLDLIGTISQAHSDKFPEGKPYFYWEAKYLPVIEWHQHDGGGLPVQS